MIEPSLGNWTWLELAILENETDETPRVKDDVALVWSQAPNFGDGAYRWSDTAFDAEHPVLRLLEVSSPEGLWGMWLTVWCRKVTFWQFASALVSRTGASRPRTDTWLLTLAATRVRYS